jgi:hypothetical protein
MVSTLKKYVGDTLFFSTFQEQEESGSTQKSLHVYETNSSFTPEEQEEFFQNLRKAHDEWVRAQNLFDHAVDPELIDYMISMMDAAEKKYRYLLKLARKQGLQLNLE